MTNQSAFTGVEVGNYRNYVKRNAIFGIPAWNLHFSIFCPHVIYFLLAYYPYFRKKVYLHNTRILAKSDPRKIVATLNMGTIWYDKHWFQWETGKLQEIQKQKKTRYNMIWRNAPPPQKCAKIPEVPEYQKDPGWWSSILLHHLSYATDTILSDLGST